MSNINAIIVMKTFLSNRARSKIRVKKNVVMGNT